MPHWVKKIADKYIKSNHATIDLVASQQVQASTSVQHIALPCHYAERNNVLRDVILVHGQGKAKTIIFVNTKQEANDILGCEAMKDAGQALHGDIPQAQREATLKAFKDGRFYCLVATDVAARGIDINDVELVIQTEPPKSVETYVHRSGRTGRANKTGISITFFTPKQLYLIQNIERSTKLTFQRKNIPTHQEILKASSFAALDALMNVHEDVVPLFEDKARAIVEKKGGVWAVAAALAVISGNTEPLKQRSLLNSSQDHFTMLLMQREDAKNKEELRSSSPIWSFIRRTLYKNGDDDKVKGITITADKLGAVFDCPTEDRARIQQIVDTFGDYKWDLSIPESLPELQQKDVQQPFESNSRGGFRGGFSGGRGGGGGFGGRDRNGGGGGFRGGGGGGFGGRDRNGGGGGGGRFARR